MEDEIDLGKLLETLLQGWRIVAAGMLACLLVAASYLLAIRSRPTLREARVLVATTRSATQVSFDTRIKTVSEDEARTVDRKQRLTSYVQMGANPTIADAVIVSLGARLPVSVRSVNTLLGMVSCDLANDSDMIAIVVRHRDPQVAALIADAWGLEYAHQVNRVYGSAETDPYATVLRETQVAQATYERDQAALVAFLSQDRSNELSRQISDTLTLVHYLIEARNRSIPMWLYEVRTQQGAHRTITLRNRDEVAAAILTDIGRAERWLANAQDLQAQVARGGSAAASTAWPALVLLKAQAYGADPIGGGAAGPLAATLQIDLAQPEGTAMAQDMLADLQALVSALEARRVVLRQELAAVTESVAEGADWDLEGLSQLTPGGTSDRASMDGQLAEIIRQAEQRTRDLQVELERERSTGQQLASRRDLAWEAYTNLERKTAELAIAAQTTDAYVRLAVPAVVLPLKRTSTVTTLLVGLVAGLMLGVIAVYLRAFWRGYRARVSGASAA